MRRTQMLVSRPWVLSVLGVASLVAAGCDPPTGPNLAALSCKCHDQASGGPIVLDARICTDLSNPDKVLEDAQSQCDAKETKCVPTCIKIENCGIFEAPEGIGMCPNNASPEAGGDFGQATAVAASVTIDVFGDDVDDFTTTLDELFVATTQSDGSLEFADIAGFASEVEFSTPGGIFGIGGGSHTLSDVHLLLTKPFSVPLDDGVFEIPEGVADFVVSARLDGDLAPLAAKSKSLEGVYLEELGIFSIFGQIDPAGADVHLDVSIQLLFQNRPPRARAGADQVVECTSSDMTSVVNLSSVDSFDLDGNTDIARHSWTVDLGTQDAETIVGRDVSIPVFLGTHAVTLAVADQKGSFGVDTVGVTVADTTGPTLDVVAPVAIAYPHTAILTLDYAVGDACTRVASQEARLDGATSVGGHGLASGEAIDLLTELALGTHTFALEAADALDNTSTSSVQFTVVVTPESLIEAVRRFAATGDISDPGVADALLHQAEAGAMAHTSGSCRRATELYRAFIRLVRRQSGKKIDPTAAEILVGDARYLIAHCP
jgi:hypothetical protein